MGVNLQEVAEPVEEKTECERPDPIMGVVSVAPVGGRRRISYAGTQGSTGAGGGGPKSREGRNEGRGEMDKAIVVHGISTNWRVSGVADCVQGIMGQVIGARCLLGAEQRVGKMASSVVVYLGKEVFLGPIAWREWNMAGGSDLGPVVGGDSSRVWFFLCATAGRGSSFCFTVVRGLYGGFTGVLGVHQGFFFCFTVVVFSEHLLIGI